MIQTLLNTGVALEPLAYVIKYYRLLGINTSHVQNVLLRTLPFFFFFSEDFKFLEGCGLKIMV